MPWDSVYLRCACVGWWFGSPFDPSHCNEIIVKPSAEKSGTRLERGVYGNGPMTTLEPNHRIPMNIRFTIALAVAARFLGGLAARCFKSAPGHAQAQAVLPEIRAHKFILVDEVGVPRGVFGIEENGTPLIEIEDSKGHVFASPYQSWGSAGSIFHSIHYPRKPTLLPIKP